MRFIVQWRLLSLKNVIAGTFWTESTLLVSGRLVFDHLQLGLI